MKQGLLGILSLSLACLLIGCASNAPKQEQMQEPKIETVEDFEIAIPVRGWDDESLSPIAPSNQTGLYTGELTDGKPSGSGKFVSENGEGLTWTYTGEFKNGTFHGQGMQVFDGDDYLKSIGTFQNGLFTPTLVELCAAMGTRENDMSFELTNASQQFVNDHKNLFPCGDAAAVQEAITLTNGDASYKAFTKNISPYTGSLYAANSLSVIQIVENPCWGYTVTQINAMDYYGNVYYIIYNGTTDIYQGDTINMRALPLANSSFHTTYGGVANCVMFFGSIIERV